MVRADGMHYAAWFQLCPAHLASCLPLPMAHHCSAGGCRAARYRSLQLRAMPAEFAAFHGLSELELSASHLGNLARLSALPGLVRAPL